MRAFLTVTLLLLAATPAPAVIRLTDDGRLAALAAGENGAYAVVDGAPGFDLVRSTGAGTSLITSFGNVESETPAVAVGKGSVSLAWARRISGGVELLVADAPLGAGGAVGETASFGVATGPPRLALLGDEPVLAFPDRIGDAYLTTAQGIGRLSQSAPAHRHLPLSLVYDGGDHYVLDLIQRRGRSELRVLGAGAPSAPVVSVGALRLLAGSLAVDSGRVYVSYFSRGRAMLATALLEPGAAWSRRTLPGPGGGDGTPALVRAADGTFVAYTQRARGRGRRRQVYLATVVGGVVDAEELTAGAADDSDPLLAASPLGDVFVGWTRRARGERSYSALLEALG